MANVKPVLICRACGASDLPDPLPKYCMECGAPVAQLKAGLFSPPNYLVTQRDSLLEKMRGEKLSPGDRIFDDSVANSQKELTRFSREAPYRLQLDCLLDGKLFLENLLHSRLTRQEVVEMTRLGQAIGSISNAISEYLKCGGKHSDRKIGQLPPVEGDGGWDQTSNYEIRGGSRPHPGTID